MSVPKLRFMEFNLPYKLTELDDALIDYSLGGNYANSYDVTSNALIKMGNLGRGYINAEKVEYIQNNERITDDHKLEIGDLLFNTRNTLDLVGKVAIWRGELERAYFNSNIMRMVFDNNYYMNYALNTKKSLTKLKAIASGTTSVAAIYTKDLKKIKIWTPSINEQTKIADFLSSVDEKITLLNKQYDLLCQYKKGIMQKIFSQEVRFKDENGEEFPEWNSCQLKEVATRVTRKNKENNQTILTISGRDGLVDQMSYFNKQIASKNVIGYYLINNGEFAYNKSYSQGYPMGAIKMLTNYDRGVVSTLYICFKLNTNQSNSFYQHYFESGLQNRSIEKVAQEGARNHGLLNIGVNDFFDIELQIPSLKEQIKISDYLSALDDKIAAKKAELDKLKTWKQGLLQQMFV